MNAQKTGFTLLELAVVIIIVGILATLTLPRFVKFKENSLEKEATANLKLIQTAEKGYRLVESQYIDGSNASALNSTLKISLPTTSAIYWEYKVVDASSTVFTAKARRTTVSGGDGTTTRCIDQDDGEPVSACSW